MSAIPQTSNPRKGLLIWLIVSQVLGVASLLLWLVAAGISVMAFDSGESPQAWAIVITVWSYPIFPLAMAIGAWIAYRRHKNILSGILSGLTFFPPFLLFMLMWIISLGQILFYNLSSH